MPAVVWKGFVSFGLVTFPVRLAAAARAEHVQFHMLHREDLSRVKEVWYCAKEDEPIDRKDMVKGYETSKGQYVVVEEEELKKIAPPTATTMDIVQFVKQDEVDPIYYESSYYVAPEGSLSKPYTLFMQALIQTKHHAIAKLAMHGREHIVLMRPHEGAMILHTLFYPNELHAANRSAPAATSKAVAKEVELAKSLVEHLARPFKPAEFHDEYRDNIERLIAEKKKGSKITEVEAPRKAPVIDLMTALKNSLAASKAKRTGTKRPASKKKSRAA